MKRFILHAVSFISLLGILFPSTSCKKESNSFDDEAQKSYEAIISMQAEGLSMLNGFEATMDSASAVEALVQWFRDTTLVESVVNSSQGLSVIYTNGIWGGIVLDPERTDDPSIQGKSRKDYSDVIPGSQLKNLPSEKTACLIAACYSEFPAANDLQDASWQVAFDNLSYNYGMLHGTEINLDFLAVIQKFGSVLCLDSHGYAWPDNRQVSEVFFKTGEDVNNTTTGKYYQDIIDHNIVLLHFINEPKSRYCIGPGFITKYNDFSQDTVMFYGGFCYSFLGNWPSIIDACASGTYFGFDWKVMSSKCAGWAIDLVDHLADKGPEQPWTVEDWMTTSPIDKQYFDAEENKTIHIFYNGNSTFSLWKAAEQGNGTIISTAPDNAPITVAGFTCNDYVLQCLPAGELPEHLGYYWDFGDGSDYYTVNDNLALTHHWALPQTYHVKVTITDIYTEKLVMELTKEISFINPDYLPLLLANTVLEAYFGPYQSIGFSGPAPTFPGFDFRTDFYDIPLTWSDLSFSSSDIENPDYETITVEGTVSADGKTLQHLLLKKVSQNEPDHELTLEITDLPIITFDQLNCITSFYVNNNGNINQTYLTRVEYKEYNTLSGTWTIISSIDWSTTTFWLEFSTPAIDLANE